MDGTDWPSNQHADGYHCREPRWEIQHFTTAMWRVRRSNQPALESWSVHLLPSTALYYYYYCIRLTAFSRTTWVSWHQKGKWFWILLEQETMGCQWHQLDHMQIICTSLQTDNHASTSPLTKFLQAGCPFCRPNNVKASNSVKALCCIIDIFSATSFAFSVFNTVSWASGVASSLQKNWVMRCWFGCLSGARCKWFAYGPADATATSSFLASLKLRLV